LPPPGWGIVRGRQRYRGLPLPGPGKLTPYFGWSMRERPSPPGPPPSGRPSAPEALKPVAGG